MEHQQRTINKNKQIRNFSEINSANHNMISSVLGGNVTDEARSEINTDSGRGDSIMDHKIYNNSTFHEFLIPITLLGKLIGLGGKFLQNICNKTNVDVTVKHYRVDRYYKIIRIHGTPKNIASTLKMVRKYLPKKTYPQLNLKNIMYEYNLPKEIPWVHQLIQLSLIEGVNNQVLVSHIVKPNHLFIQLPTHPTYPLLRILDDKMTQLYDTVNSPLVPEKLNKGMIFVAKWYSKWVRVYVECPDPNGKHTLVRLVDHGGYRTFSNSDMRQIHSDYLRLPFQAIEVFLAHINPKQKFWSQQAYDVVSQICTRIIGQAQVVGYLDCSTFINLYFNCYNYGIVSVAEELITRRMARPMAFERIRFTVLPSLRVKV